VWVIVGEWSPSVDDADAGSGDPEADGDGIDESVGDAEFEVALVWVGEYTERVGLGEGDNDSPPPEKVGVFVTDVSGDATRLHVGLVTSDGESDRSSVEVRDGDTVLVTSDVLLYVEEFVRAPATKTTGWLKQRSTTTPIHPSTSAAALCPNERQNAGVCCRCCFICGQ
jgi:hypothetical protein